MNDFASRLLAWFDHAGRHDLPWQHPRDAYRVWVSEIMLQQTQVSTVIDYFQRFMQALPTLPDLAAADEDTVLALWSGLGYYRRARFLHAAAQRCVAEFGGQLPRDIEQLSSLPGIGRSTAGAILAQAHGLKHPILDGNVKRVLTRFHGVRGHPGKSAVEKQLWAYADQHTPDTRLADYTQAIMDLGATLCTRSQPRCGDCPLHNDCVAFRDGLTAQLPESKPAKAIPTRTTHMLILRDGDGRILLQKRDERGVWAGLWSLPEAADEHALLARSQGLAHGGKRHALASFTHVFSHYRLAVTPWLLDMVTPQSIIADNGHWRWTTRDDLAALGLPAPVRQLLNSIWETSTS
ncbi:A/G-specific adenine glycosylase [Oleiagrimonas sp. C23AA]|uniref:A/G-specific adenine glycosylase n=1 Tax=Oleiagrimonas sp. C23AA TaxID=2719047 RepID=UPI00141E8AFD|nr:A/G-specific adenine glycosylase [Oleiagrimonas sp. C23AA]NII11557.1 A/G-specific adenine glycosylase [Oleiagrimonas sp. C23AA]